MYDAIWQGIDRICEYVMSVSRRLALEPRPTHFGSCGRSSATSQAFGTPAMAAGLEQAGLK